MQNLSQDNQSPGRDLNSGRLEYEAGVITTFGSCNLVYFSTRYKSQDFQETCEFYLFLVNM
jgi:hypothetical protein